MCPEGIIAVPRARARSGPIIAALNDRWRIMDHRLQWILQVRQGPQRKKASGWRVEHYCRQRTSLLRCIREYCGEVDPAALAVIETFPDWHPDYNKQKNPTATVGDCRASNHSWRSDSDTEPLKDSA